jgi:hypothetical protein
LVYQNSLERLKRAAELPWNYEFLPEGFPYQEIRRTTDADIARWILLNPERSLNERIDGQKAAISLSATDEVALLTLGRFLAQPKKSSLLGFMVPYECSAFSLLLGFYSLIQAVLDHNYQIGINIPPESGVLLISPNNELSSRLLRTHYGQSYLGNIYEVLRVKIDGSMEQLDRGISVPTDARWFAVFKASRKELPPSLDRKPSLILVDLLPWRLRNRLDGILDWCAMTCPEVPIVVIAPEGDIEITNKLNERHATVCHLGAADDTELSLITGRQRREQSSRAALTAAWGIKRNYREIPSLHIHKILEQEDIEEEFHDILKLISSTEHEKWGIPNVFRRVQRIAWALRDLMCPLRHYELLVHDGLSLRSTIISLKNAVPINDWERRVFDTTLPLAVEKLLSIYDTLRALRLPPKAMVLISLLDDLLKSKHGEIVVLVPTDEVVTALATWLDVELDGSNRERVQIYSVRNYVQRRQLVLIDTATPSDLIFSTAIFKRNSSILFSELAPTVHFLTFPKETAVAKMSLHQAYFNRARWRSSWLQTIYQLYDIHYEREVNYNSFSNVDVNEHSYALGSRQQTIDSAIVLIDPDSLNTDALMKFWSNFNTPDPEDNLPINQTLSLASRFAHVTTNTAKGICAVFQGGSRIFLSLDKTQQYFSHIKGELISDTPEKIRRRDVLVSINADAKKDLFNEVIQGIGLTPMMVALYGYLDQWRTILSMLISKHTDSYAPYVSVLRDIKKHGGNVKSIQSIKHWIDGDTEYLQKKQNVYAVCLAAELNEPKKMSDLIYTAMQQLWNFRRSLGRKLNSLIRHQISRVVDSNKKERINDVIQAPGGVSIPLADIVEALEVYEVESIDPEDVWVVPTDLLGWIISKDDWMKIQHTVRHGREQ